MAESASSMVKTASGLVDTITPQEAHEMVKAGNAVLVDVREAGELQQTGKAEGALAIPRGLLEFKADPDNAMADPALSRDVPVILYCAAGGRAALAGKTLQEMGYARVLNMGGFKDWAEAGLPVEPVEE